MAAVPGETLSMAGTRPVACRAKKATRAPTELGRRTATTSPSRVSGLSLRPRSNAPATPAQLILLRDRLVQREVGQTARARAELENARLPTIKLRTGRLSWSTPVMSSRPSRPDTREING